MGSLPAHAHVPFKFQVHFQQSEQTRASTLSQTAPHSHTTLCKPSESSLTCSPPSISCRVLSQNCRSARAWALAASAMASFCSRSEISCFRALTVPCSLDSCKDGHMKGARMGAWHEPIQVACKEQTARPVQPGHPRKCRMHTHHTRYMMA